MLSPNYAQAKNKIPKTVWALGFVSLLMDTSSEMIFSLLPLFMTSVLGMGALSVGIIEGAAEATALIVKVFSGVLSDYLGKRKRLAVIGYSLAALTKPFFAIASGVSVIFGARIIDRVGKGIRGAPRDALIADITPPQTRGAAFGLRQAMDTVGAFAGPLMGAAFMFLLADNFRAVFWIACVPAAMAVFILIAWVKEPEQKAIKIPGNPISSANLKKMGGAYWSIVIVGGLFGLARFSEAFLVLRAKDLGVPLAAVPLVMVFMNIVYAFTAYPFGKLSDKIGRGGLLALGVFILFCANIALAKAMGLALLGAGIFLWGLHLGITQGLLSALVADAAPGDMKGTAFGFFNLISGIAVLIASIAAGFLWQRFGASATFYFGAAFCAAAFIAIISAAKAFKRGQSS